MKIKTGSLKKLTPDDDDDEMASNDIGREITIITGGAQGADTLAEQCAKEWGMKVKLKLCPHHHRVSDDHPCVSRSGLNDVAPQVHVAAARLGRQPAKNPFVKDLLARNWFIMQEARAVFAYARFEDDSLTTVEGGTGWTVQMCVDPDRDFPEMWKELFVYDYLRKRCYELERWENNEDDYVPITNALGDLQFRECFCCPLLHNRSAVVGHRVLGPDAIETMRQQFKRTIKERQRRKSKDEKEVEDLRKNFEKLHI